MNKKKIASSGGAGGGGAGRRTDKFNDLPLDVQARIGLFLTPQERANSRYMGRAESLAFSVHPARVYRLKSKITVKFDYIPTFLRLKKTFGIFTDATGNLRVEDFRDMFPPSGFAISPPLELYRDNTWREIYERLPDAVRATNNPADIFIVIHYYLRFWNGELFRNFTSGLWTAEELSQELQSRTTGNEQPFSLVRVKRFTLGEADIQRMLEERPDFASLGTVGTQDPIANIQSLFGITLSHEIITEKFRIA